MALLLEAAAVNLGTPEGDENIEHLRFKCLLIHERIENIRNHLECGLPLKVRLGSYLGHPILNTIMPLPFLIKKSLTLA